MRLRPKPERTSCWIPLGLMIIKNAATVTVDFNKGGLLSIKIIYIHFLCSSLTRNRGTGFFLLEEFCQAVILEFFSKIVKTFQPLNVWENFPLGKFKKIFRCSATYSTERL